MNELVTLARYYQDLLLAETIGWLHDYRKCSEEHLQTQSANLNNKSALPRNIAKSNYPHLENINIIIPAQLNSRTISELLNEKTPGSDPLVLFLSRCHNTAHFDKQHLEKEYGKQNYPISHDDPRMQLSTPFGYEKNIFDDLTNQLWSLPWNLLDRNFTDVQRKFLRDNVKKVFSLTVADTRRPINEVDLWNWGLLVGSLYKSALAGALLSSSTPDANHLRWRLLGIRVNGLDYLSQVARIPDMLARKELLTESLNRVQELLEVTYPLGSEVYRDENGSIFVVPDLPELLKETNANGTNLRELILQEFKKGTLKSNSELQQKGEVIPSLELGATPWWGQDPEWKNKTNDQIQDKIPDISDMLLKPLVLTSSPEEIKDAWQSEMTKGVCTVCGLRPQGPSKKATERNVCDTCERRRGDRSQQWVESYPDKTIWTDEVADINGRLALITGHFDLNHWLSKRLLDSLFVIPPNDHENNKGKPVTLKTPSFSRLRRIWETTRVFWEDVQKDILQKLSDDRRRLRIYLDSKPDLGKFHVYDLDLGDTELNLVWVPSEDSAGGFFLSADNLDYIACRLGVQSKEDVDSATAAISVEDYLQERFVLNVDNPVLRNPDIQPGQVERNPIAGKKIVRVEYQENPYATAIPLFAQPKRFMALVPANKSLEIIREIRDKYNREMGKVRNRLPLHLGVVYAHRRTPWRAIVDAGRRLLKKRPLNEDKTWTVLENLKQEELPDTKNKKHPQFNETNIIKISQDNKVMKWYVPAKMGDGETEDKWYPYVFFHSDRNGQIDFSDGSRKKIFENRQLDNFGYFKAPLLVHASELKEGDQVYFTPATFDFEWLDTSARRFEIAYDEQGNRLSRYTRPYLLDDLDSLQDAWDILNGLTSSQIYALRDLIESSREQWYEQPSQSLECQVLPQMCHDAVCNANWSVKPSEEDIQRLTNWAVKGIFADVIELYMGIMKKNPKKDQ